MLRSTDLFGVGWKASRHCMVWELEFICPVGMDRLKAPDLNSGKLRWCLRVPGLNGVVCAHNRV